MANIFGDWWDLGKNVRIPDEDLSSWKNLFKDDWEQRQRQSVGGKKVWNPFRGFVVQDAAKGGLKSGPTPLVRQVGNRFVSPILKTLMNVGSKALKFPNPITALLQGLVPSALGGGIDEHNPYYDNQVNIFNQGRIDASEFIKPTPVPTYNPPQGPAGFTQPVTQPVNQPVTQPITQPPTDANAGFGQTSTYVPKRRDVIHKANATVNRINRGQATPVARRTGGKYGFGL